MSIFKKIGLIAVVLFFAACLTACSSGSGASSDPDPLVGEWRGEATVGLFTVYDGALSVLEDGSVAMTLSSDDHSGAGVSLDFEGTWSPEGDSPFKDEVGEGQRVYRIVFEGVDYYVIYGELDGVETVALSAVADSGEIDYTKVILSAERDSGERSLSAEEIEAQIAEQPVFVSSVEYLVQDERLKSLYPDFLMATVQNNSGVPVRHVTIGFVAWDKQGLPTKIYPKGDGVGYYYVECSMTDANILDGASWCERGVELSGAKPLEIDSFKAVVSSYTTLDGETWSNPLLESWQETYENKPL